MAGFVLRVYSTMGGFLHTVLRVSFPTKGNLPDAYHAVVREGERVTV